MEQQYRIAIEPKVYFELEKESREEHRDATEIVNDVLRRHLLLRQMKQLQQEIEPLARDVGWNSEEDVFRDVS